MLERSLTPALLVVAVLAAVTSARLGLALAIAWLAVTTLNVVARGLLAARHEFAGKPVSLRQGVGRAYVASWLLDLVVWSGLLLSLAAAEGDVVSVALREGEAVWQGLGKPLLLELSLGSAEGEAEVQIVAVALPLEEVQ